MVFPMKTAVMESHELGQGGGKHTRGRSRPEAPRQSGAANAPPPGRPSRNETEFCQAVRDLRPLAARLLRRERAGQTLQPTALVHEAYANLARGVSRFALSVTHFRKAAYPSMKHILIERFRRKNRIKHGGEFQRIPYSFAEYRLMGTLGVPTRAVNELAVQEALGELETAVRAGARERRVVEMHFFEGYSFAEIAEILGVSSRQIVRDWRHARVWLARELGRGADGGE